jgi:hypothetical protein
VGTYTALATSTYVDGYDMTSDLNATSLKIARQAVDVTAFSATARSRIAALEDVQSSVDGYWQAGTGAVDPQIFGNLGALKVATQTPAGVEGDRAYFYQCRDVEYQMFGNVGEVTPFSLALRGVRGSGTLSAGAVAGYLAKAKGSVSATGVLGSSKQLGAVGAGQHLYAAVHVFAAGTTLTMVLESDPGPTFSSATTRATIGALTAVGGTWMTRVPGPITDTYYRLRVTSVTGTFTVAAAFGVK